MAKAKKQFDPAKLAALFEDAGTPTKKVEVKKNDPTVTGKGVAKAVAAHKANKELEQVVTKSSKKKAQLISGPHSAAAAKVEEELGPTAKDKKRQYDAAKQKAMQRVLTLPPSDKDREVLRTTELPPETKVMRYHGGSGWSVCLMWLEHTERDGSQILSRIHTIMQTDSGSLGYTKKRPEELRHFAEILGGYPVGVAISAFREHADLNGSTKEVRQLLGMQGDPPPKMEKVIERDDRGLVVAERMVPRKNANKQPGGPVSEEIDELYKRAAKLLDLNETDLRNKYRHLNPGLQAMNLRNRLRAKGHNV